MRHPTLQRSTLAAALALALCAPFASHAQDQQTGSAEQDKPKSDKVDTLDKVTVVGSRIKRVEVEGPAAVQIVTAEEIKKEGWVNVYDMLTTLTQATGTVQADSDWATDTPNASPLNFRNLGPNRSLLLVNGRRVADYPMPYEGQTNFANYGNIPSAAVERIEVLSGGASAIYGSDAIGGVINVILRQDYDGDQVRFRAGTSTEGGRNTVDMSWAGGKKHDRWGVTYALQYQKRDPLFGRDRPAMDDSDDAPRSSWWPEQVGNGGFRPQNGIGLIDLSTGLRQSPPPGACDQFGGEYYLANRRTWNRNATNPDGSRGASIDTGWLCGMSADFANWMLQSGSENTSGNLYGHFDINDDLQAWSSISVFKSNASFGTTPPSWAADGLGNGYYYDIGTDQYLLPVRQFTPQEAGGVNGLRNSNSELSWDFTAGLKGVFADRFDWEFSAGRSRYTVSQRDIVIDQAKADDFFLGPELGRTPDNETIRDLDESRFWRPLTRDEYNSLFFQSVNKAYSWTNQAQFTVSGQLFEGWAGPIDFAGTLEWARQGYNLQPDLSPVAAAQNPNLNLGGGERSRYSAGVEFRVPLLDSVVATMAARHDRYGSYKTYSDVPLVIDSQAENTWNLGLEWRPLDNLLLRGTYATSFHAPDMHYIMGQPSVSYETSLDIRRCIETGANVLGTCSPENLDVWYLKNTYRRGTPDLASETGDSWGLGVVWDATDNLSFTADYYAISIDDMIRDRGSDEIRRDEAGCVTGKNLDGSAWINPGGSAYCSAILAAVHRGADGKITTIDVGPFNMAQKKVRGIDLSARWRVQTANWGEFSFGANYTNALSTLERTEHSDPMQERRDFEVRSKFRGSVSWQRGNWNAAIYGDRAGTVRSVRFGGCAPLPDGFELPSETGCKDVNPSSPTYGQSTERIYPRVGPFITVNFNAGYKFTDFVRVNFYVNNVTNATVWNHKDPYKMDYAFGPTRMLGVVGREWALEYVFDF